VIESSESEMSKMCSVVEACEKERRNRRHNQGCLHAVEDSEDLYEDVETCENDKDPKHVLSRRYVWTSVNKDLPPSCTPMLCPHRLILAPALLLYRSLADLDYVILRFSRYTEMSGLDC